VKSILVICEGNICRSPMAEGLFKEALPGFTVRSAGLGAMVGMPADESAIQLMRDKGLDISAHRATQINRPMCVEADLLLVMDVEQRSRMADLYPQLLGKTFRLGEYTKQDIPDPHRAPRAEFRKALALIEAGVAEWLHRIRKL
jgi:protein-tyrosine phosphatase